MDRLCLKDLAWMNLLAETLVLGQGTARVMFVSEGQAKIVGMRPDMMILDDIAPSQPQEPPKRRMPYYHGRRRY